MKAEDLAPFLRSQIAVTEWDEFVAGCDAAWLWHLADFQEVMIHRGLTDASFGLRSPAGELLAVVPLHLRHHRELGVFPWRSMHSHGGPALANYLGRKQERRVQAAIRAHLLHLAHQNRVAEISFALPPVAAAYRGERCPRVNPLLHLGCDNTLTTAWMVDLRRPIEEIRATYPSSTRQDLAHARKNGFELHEASGQVDLEIYYALHLDTCRRTGDIPHPYAYFRHVLEVSQAAGLCRILFFVQRGRVMAGQCTGLHKGGANYWFGASRSDKPVHGGENRTLFDDQFRFAREQGAEWYFLGDALERGPLQGISEFKGSFGSVLYPYYKGLIIVDRRTHVLVSHLNLLTRRAA